MSSPHRHEEQAPPVGVIPRCRDDFAALAIWAGGTIMVGAWVYYLSYVETTPNLPTIPELASRFARFDFVHFDDIARLGYLPDPNMASTSAPLYAFFPAVPMLLRVGLALSLSSVVTGLLVSFVGGAVATVWMRRIADLYLPGLGLKAAAVFVVAPPAIFLYAPYTESLFLAFALGAWYCGMRGRWAAAGVLCALSCTVRISGAFLLVALLVLWLTQRTGGDNTSGGSLPRRSVFFLSLPVGVLAGWMAYLASITGDLFAYGTAQKYELWNRHLEWPWVAFLRTLYEYPPTGGAGLMGYAEIIAVFSGAIVTVALAIRRLWGEAVFVGLNLVLLGTSTYYFSVPRSSLLWWPLWIGIAYLLRKNNLALSAYLLGSAYMWMQWSALFLGGQWAG